MNVSLQLTLNATESSVMPTCFKTMVKSEMGESIGNRRVVGEISRLFLEGDAIRDIVSKQGVIGKIQQQD